MLKIGEENCLKSCGGKYPSIEKWVQAIVKKKKRKEKRKTVILIVCSDI